jgi:hypothetical protein
MGKTGSLYTRQCFMDAARRRAREARALLDYPTSQKQRDGAVTMALIAAECALKAALLQGLQANSVDDLAGRSEADLFRGTTGHDLLAIWRGLPTTVGALATPAESQALSLLRQANPYEHRYGAKKPQRSLAEPLIQSAECLVDWMRRLAT